MKTVIFDVDGCLADFVMGFTKEVMGHGSEKHYLLEPWGTRENRCKWDFSDVFTKKQVEDAWSRIKNSRDWWTKLPALEDEHVFDQIDALQNEYHVLFVTARVGWNPQQQTQRWLWYHGVDDASVVVSAKKGEIANAVKASYHIDDKPENACCVHWMSESTKSYFLQQYYRPGQEIVPERVRRVKSVQEYLDDIKEGK